MKVIILPGLDLRNTEEFYGIIYISGGVVLFVYGIVL